jgi:hypothetical protein
MVSIDKMRVKVKMMLLFAWILGAAAMVLFAFGVLVVLTGTSDW